MSPRPNRPEDQARIARPDGQDLHSRGISQLSQAFNCAIRRPGNDVEDEIRLRMGLHDHVFRGPIRCDVRNRALVAALAQQVPQLVDGVRAFADEDDDHENRTFGGSIGRRGVPQPSTVVRAEFGSASARRNAIRISRQCNFFALSRFWVAAVEPRARFKRKRTRSRGRGRPVRILPDYSVPTRITRSAKWR